MTSPRPSAKASFWTRAWAQIAAAFGGVAFASNGMMPGAIVAAAAFIGLGIAGLMVRCPRCGNRVVVGNWVPRTCRFCGLATGSTWPPGGQPNGE